MAEPVLVMHGVGNPRPEGFHKVVDALQARVGSGLHLIEVFWGDLGGGRTGFEDAVPEVGEQDEESVASMVPGLAALPTDGVGPSAVSSDDQRAAVIAAAARPTELETIDPLLHASVLGHLRSTVHLRDVTNPETLRAVGELIAAAAAQDAAAVEAGEAEAEGLVSSTVGHVLQVADRLVGAAVGEALGRFNELARKQLVPAAAGFIGDVIAYQHHRAAIQQRIWDAIDEHVPDRGTPNNPIHVVAHSLGGVIMFHAATAADAGRQLWIDTFVTFGSQSSLFHLIDPRQSGLSAYTPGTPVTVPSIRRWTNLWEPLDPLAFLAGSIFVLADTDGGRTSPRDVAVRHLLSSGVFTHGTYWESDELVDTVRSLASR